MPDSARRASLPAMTDDAIRAHDLILTILFDGIAYGMLLFVLACGLAVTLGLMNFVNLAHGAFAMAGGYVCAVLVNRCGWPFFAALPLAFLASALIGLVLERTLYRHVYTRAISTRCCSPSASSSWRWRRSTTSWARRRSSSTCRYAAGPVRCLRRRRRPLSADDHRDLRPADAARCNSMLARTRFGSRLRAAVDDPRAASGLGINVPQVFALTFAFGCGLAGLGGALGAEILGLDPYFPLKFMIYFLIVVTVGGTSSITGPFLASLLLGVADVAGKYYVPKLGAFVIYTIMIVILIWRPQRPVRPHRGAVSLR